MTRPGKLIYVVSPSGAGKDALLDHARAHLPPQANVKFARRWVTRPANAGGESHHALTSGEFDEKVRAGAFAMHWRAHGNGYGIGQEIRDRLQSGASVVVSGSREHLPLALRDFPDLHVVQVVVDPAVLRERLLRRGRETPAQVDERVQRAARHAIPQGIPRVDVRNDGRLEDAEADMLAAIAAIARG
ncbi:MAG: phosphonate metabolism protein/1,5-bisphosphokinase (PRPP-forming) PhnN [Betaproteobacteria bacterium]|nr:phosphonate metabolism protein/1,5-bisphosphokinase (PRPP-forming) PhnN [Betaproteobacteria bacterium]